jgi:hypothetical protein
MLSVRRELRVLKREDFIHLRGCPVSVAEQVLALVEHGKLVNPYFDLQMLPSFMSTYFSWRTRTLMQRVFGQAYNKPGPTHRGQARPGLNLPPSDADARLELPELKG